MQILEIASAPEQVCRGTFGEHLSFIVMPGLANKQQANLREL
jgi:hypothetical protein